MLINNLVVIAVLPVQPSHVSQGRVQARILLAADKQSHDPLTLIKAALCHATV